MITYLKKHTHNKSLRKKKPLDVYTFKKPIIRVLDEPEIVAESEAVLEPDAVLESDAVVESGLDDSYRLIKDIGDTINTIEVDDDTIMFNTAKIVSASKNMIETRQDFKKTIMTNANVVKEMLMKTVDKHKIELCAKVATQMVEIYKEKHRDDL